MYNLPVDYTKLDWKQRKEVREQYVIEQNNKCFYCGCPLTEPPLKEITDELPTHGKANGLSF